MPHRPSRAKPSARRRRHAAHCHQTNRTQLNHAATVDEHNPLDTMRLRVVEPNNITSP
jgi:hypothetical protein